MQILEGLRGIVNGASQVIEGVNPGITTMDEQNRTIASSLLASGLTIEQIQDFVDVSRIQLDKFLEVEVEVQKRMAEAKAVMSKAPGAKVT